MRYVIIAEHNVKRAGRMEARTLGFVDADSRVQARRLAEATFPGLTLTISQADSQPPSTPKGGCRGGNQ
jgi:hypothetical protein